MAQEHIPDERIISAKFAGRCTECGLKFPMGKLIKFNTYKRTARHVKCPEQSYDGNEQRDMLDTWVKVFQEMEGK